jgi:hypothetical protein
MPNNGRKRVALYVVAAVAVGAILFLAYTLIYPRTTTIGGQSYNTGKNGLWLRYLWYFGKKNDAEMTRMADLLKRQQIKYAMFHVPGAKKDGSLEHHYVESARKLIQFVHREVPGTKVIAWVYVGNMPDTGGVNLNSASVRRKLVEEAVWLVEECGLTVSNGTMNSQKTADKDC